MLFDPPELATRDCPDPFYDVEILLLIKMGPPTSTTFTPKLSVLLISNNQGSQKGSINRWMNRIYLRTQITFAIGRWISINKVAEEKNLQIDVNQLGSAAIADITAKALLNSSTPRLVLAIKLASIGKLMETFSQSLETGKFQSLPAF